MKNMILKEGKIMPFTAAANIAAGDLVLVGSMVGVACADVANTEEGEMAISGVFEVGKEADNIAVGVVLYYLASSGKLTTTAGSNKVAGYAWAAAGTSATTVLVKLLF